MTAGLKIELALQSTLLRYSGPAEFMVSHTKWIHFARAMTNIKSVQKKFCSAHIPF